jgi:hypothetical protein
MGSRQELARRTLLRELGVELHETTTIFPPGFFLLSHYPEDNIALITNVTSPSVAGTIAVKYEGQTDPVAMEALQQLLPTQSVSLTTLHTPKLISQDVDEIFKRLKSGVKEYAPQTVTLKMTAVNTKDLLLMSSFVSAFKYRQIDKLFALYQEIGLQPFSALNATFASGGGSIVTPPVVEEHPEGLVVIEGTTRAAYSNSNNISTYPCILVRGVKERLPYKSYSVNDVTVSERSLPNNIRREEGGASQAKAFIRYIERAVHPY